MAFTTALVLFGLLTLVLLSIEIFFTYATKGFAFGFSANRDPSVEYSTLALRIKRVYLNQVESAAYIVPVLAAAAVTGLESEAGQTAALLIVLGRAAFAALYYTGIPFVRVLAFAFGTMPTLFVGYLVLVGATM